MIPRIPQCRNANRFPLIFSPVYLWQRYIFTFIQFIAWPVILLRCFKYLRSDRVKMFADSRHSKISPGQVCFWRQLCAHCHVKLHDRIKGIGECYSQSASHARSFFKYLLAISAEDGLDPYGSLDNICQEWRLDPFVSQATLCRPKFKLSMIFI